MNGLFVTLDLDWQHLLDRRSTGRQYRTWRCEHPVFAAYPNLSGLMAAARHQDSPGDADRILAALAERAGDDDLAARALLQAILPGLRTLASAHHWIATIDDLEADLVAIAWQHIRSYPIHTRPRRIAANLLLDTGHHLRRDNRSGSKEIPSNSLTASDLSSEATPAEELTALVVRAVEHGYLRAGTASLILRTRVLDQDVADIAAGVGYPTDTIRHRRRRAEQILKAVA